ncbi:MAG: hypothetical protein JWO08_2044 [Verrucomicrobiaceae bacterium]|nr:hypothetical protein [Verrucomicrobiaceae bacterium]
MKSNERIAMEAREPTAFEERVYDAARMIPKGFVSTYSIIGKMIGCRSSLAVGRALSRCPYGTEVPCHRVIRTDLTLGGFGSQPDGPETAVKARLLASEGVRFKDSTLVDISRLWAGL